MLYHFCEDAAITRFEPRPSKNAEGDVVWAVSADRLRNYLLPRECPRVTFFAGKNSTPGDIDRYLGGSASVVAFEAAWLERVNKARLYCYHLPADSFVCVDTFAGYFQSRQAVLPEHVEVKNPPCDRNSCILTSDTDEHCNPFIHL
jgi:hypothetical protein